MPRFTDGETEARRDPGLESNSDLILMTFSFLFSFFKKILSILFIFLVVWHMGP